MPKTRAKKRRQKGQGYFAYRRPDRVGFLVRYLDPISRKWRDRTIPREANIHTLAAAESYGATFYAVLKQEQASGKTDVRVSSPSLRMLARRWLELREVSEIRRSTLYGNASHLEKYILADIGDIPIAELGTARLRAFVRSLRTKKPPIASHTVRNIVATLTQLFRDAMAEEWVTLQSNPMRHDGVRAELPAGQSRAGQKRTVIHLTVPQAEKLLSCSAVPEARRLRYLLALTTGLRDGELAALRWNNIELETEVPHLTVRKAIALLGPKGHATESDPKTHEAKRTVPLHVLTARTLRAWKACGWERSQRRKPKPDDLIFPSTTGGPHRPPSAKLLRRDLAEAGCPTTYADLPIDFHACRRSFATWLAEEEVDHSIRKRLMGHRAADVTEAHYTTRSLKRLGEAIAKIPLKLTASEIVSVPLAIVPSEPANVANYVATPEASATLIFISDVISERYGEPISRLELETCGLRKRARIQQFHELGPDFGRFGPVSDQLARAASRAPRREAPWRPYVRSAALS
jgi:integrase